MTASRSCASSGSKPGPLVGKAWNYLLELRLSEGMLGQERATAELLAWAEREGIERSPFGFLMVSAAYSAPAAT